MNVILYKKNVGSLLNALICTSFTTTYVVSFIIIISLMSNSGQIHYFKCIILLLILKGLLGRVIIYSGVRLMLEMQ